MPIGPFVGIDVGGTGIKGAPTNLDTGGLLRERIRVPTPQPSTPAAVADVVASVLEKIQGDGPVGVTLPGVVTGGVVRTAANINKEWIGVNAIDLFTEATGRPVTVVNDADAAGLAEVRFGAGTGRRGTVIVVTLGTGIGSALFVDGALVPNTEFGHLHLHHGDAEDWAAELVREREGLSWEQYAHRIEQYFRLVQRLFWPDLIIVGGGASRKAEKFLPLVNVDTEVVAAALQNDAGIVGAALLAASHLRAGSASSAGPGFGTG
ncbi:polyphosphate--glucose phosphotransferase [Rugosimonospora africana]|uniref:Polyphosphate glucokinase n=1 Tax=Rugosimonospora africana TaxID=556532 RepID=A0A8J3QT68_9ACTN|nr:ROK family protein [Rugosimonospora africana]GIH16019.1 polyphosphate glucokinase [Rugosimonospora africana]